MNVALGFVHHPGLRHLPAVCSCGYGGACSKDATPPATNCTRPQTHHSTGINVNAWGVVGGGIPHTSVVSPHMLLQVSFAV